jgi:Putative rRNA methylase
MYGSEIVSAKHERNPLDMELPNLRTLSHILVKPLLAKGGVVVDGTAGQGVNTHFLCEAVGSEGQVYALDHTEEPLVETMKRLDDHHHLDRVSLLIGHPGHLFESLPEQVKGSLAGCMFNLCDRPHFDLNLASHQEATIRDIQKALSWLGPGGFVSVLAPAGLVWMDELAKELDAGEYECLRCECVNNGGEVLHVLRRLKHKLGSAHGQSHAHYDQGRHNFMPYQARAVAKTTGRLPAESPIT